LLYYPGQSIFIYSFYIVAEGFGRSPGSKVTFR
jgi:hypothetical protein